MCGIYAKIDITRGVRRAPASVRLAGIVDLEVTIDTYYTGNSNAHHVADLPIKVSGSEAYRPYRTCPSGHVSKSEVIPAISKPLLKGQCKGWGWNPNACTFEANLPSDQQFPHTQWRKGPLHGAPNEDALASETMTHGDVLNGRFVYRY